MLNDDERYLFDLNGYIVLENVLTPEEVADANAAIDHHSDQIRLRDREQSLSGGSSGLEGMFGRGGLFGMLGWEEPYCLPFRQMLVHPRIVSALNEILGKGFRMDHQMFLLTMEKGTEGLIFHGSSGPGFDPNQYYIWKNGRMHNGLTVVTFQLTDVNPGDGGLAVIPGSHKSNVACPTSIQRYKEHQDEIRQVVCRAGDVVILSEATTHGTLPWTAEYPRRSILTRYTVGNLSYVPAYDMPEWANERERAVMEKPYHSRLKRPFLEE